MILQRLVAAASVLTKAGKLTMFADSADNLFKTKDAAGIVKVLGNGIKTFAKVAGTGAEGTFDTYRLTRDDNATTDIQVYNGADGRSITSISAPATPGLPGATDTYTINYSKAPLTTTFSVYNGKDGVIQFVNGKTGANVTLNAADVGAIAAAEKGAANGVASLDGSGKVPAAQLPAFVDDVLEFADLASFPGTGETGKIYVAIDNGRTYRWSGSVYTEISAAPVTQVNGKVGNVTLVTTDIAEGTNLYFTAQRVRDTVLTGLSVATNAVIAAGDSVLSAFGKLQAQISAINTFLGGPDPFPQYTSDAESASIANSAIAAHVGQADPHGQYTTAAEASAAAPVQSVNGQTGAVSLALGTSNPATTRSAASASFSTALTTVQSYPIATGEIVPGTMFTFFAQGRVINTTATSNLVATLSVGATNVLVLTQALGATARAAPGQPFTIQGEITFYSATQAEARFRAFTSSAVAFDVGLDTSASITVAAGGTTTLDLKLNTSAATSTLIVRQSNIWKVK